MNPSILHFSRGWKVVQLSFMLGIGAILIWLLSETGLFGPQRPLTDPMAGVSLNGDQMAYIARLVEARSSQQSKTDYWFSNALLLACLPMLIWDLVVKSWQIGTSVPLLAVQQGQLIPHASFLTAPENIPLHAIRGVRFDRSDRVRLNSAAAAVTAFSWSHHLGMRLGQRLRHTLLIEYLTERGESKSFKVNDSDVEGGAEQLARFAAYLRQFRSSSASSIVG